MRIYEGSPRQDFEEVFRSIGAFLDQRAMKEVLLAEAPDGFIVQGLVSTETDAGTWSEAIGTQTKETLTFLDDDIARFMDEAVARRNRAVADDWSKAGYYERAFRVLGRYMDEQKPRDTFFFEQDGAFVRPAPDAESHRQPARPGRIHSRGHRRDDRPGSRPPRSRTEQGQAGRRLDRRAGDARSRRKDRGRMKTIVVALGITLGALIVIPLLVLAGLFIWLKVTEGDDEDVLELDQEGV